MNAWIQVIGEQEAEGDLKRIYDEVRDRRGSLSNVMKVHSLDPESIPLHLDLYLHLMFGKSTLTRQEREMIAVVVSHLNKCAYCVTHHGEALLAHAKERQLVEKLENMDFASLSQKNRVMLEYASKLSKEPGKMRKQDVDKLRTVGFSDEEILRVNLIVSYFNFVNRIVSGLGVTIEESEARVYKY